LTDKRHQLVKGSDISMTV